MGGAGGLDGCREFSRVGSVVLLDLLGGFDGDLLLFRDVGRCCVVLVRPSVVDGLHGFRLRRLVLPRTRIVFVLLPTSVRVQERVQRGLTNGSCRGRFGRTLILVWLILALLVLPWGCHRSLIGRSHSKGRSVRGTATILLLPVGLPQRRNSSGTTSSVVVLGQSVRPGRRDYRR